MDRVMRVGIGIVVLMLLLPPRDLFAQVSVGAAFIVDTAHQPSDTVAVETSQFRSGVSINVGVGKESSLLGFQGEVSIPARTGLSRQYRSKSFDASDSATYRDVTVTGLLRVGPARRCCDLLAGGGFLFSSGTGNSVTVWRSEPGAPVTEAPMPFPASTGAVIAVGGDAPIPAGRRFSVVPTLRGYWMIRTSVNKGGLSSPLAPSSSFALRFGVGGRVHF